MEIIKTSADLKIAISKLEKRQEEEEINLRQQFHEAYNSIKPINLIKNSLKEATEDIDIKKTIINSTVGLTSGVLSGFLFKNIVRHPIKKLIGSAIVYGITNYAAKHPETVKSVGGVIANLFRKKSSDSFITGEKTVL